MLPADVTNEPPWWRLGKPAVLTTADVAAELLETSIVAESLSNKYRKVDAEVKLWFAPDGERRSLLQCCSLIRTRMFRGRQLPQTPRVLPMGPMLAKLFLNYTENHLAELRELTGLRGAP